MYSINQRGEPMKIWCIEDDININNLVVYAMESSGYEARGFTTYAEFDRAMKNEIPDLLILDVMLPDMDGMEILQQLRKNSATRHQKCKAEFQVFPYRQQRAKLCHRCTTRSPIGILEL